MKRIALFASGNGTNAEAICEHLQGRTDMEVALMICNRREAGVYGRMERFGVPCMTCLKADWATGEGVLKTLKEKGIDFIVLAGFLAKVPDAIIDAYPRRIVNLHPALLPRHGGPGMYGHHVHEDVLRDGDTESGITIHYVNNVVDGGAPILQARCPVMPGDTPDTLAARIHTLEHAFLPPTVALLVSAI